MTLQRRTPLRSEKPLTRSGPIQRKPAKVRAGAQPDTVRVRKRSGMAEARRESFGRSGGLCAICRAREATHAHHRKLKSQGGKDTPENLLPLCALHHHLVHHLPEVSKEQGYIVARWDIVTPWWLLPWWAELRAS